MEIELDLQEQRLVKAVNEFASRMKLKLIEKYHRGYSGWDDDKYLAVLKKKLKKHINKGDMVDVANFAMIIWNIENK